MDRAPVSLLAPHTLSASTFAKLDALKLHGDVVCLKDEPRATAELICVGMAHEMGSANDQLTTAIWDYARARPFALGELTAEVEEIEGEFALVVSSAGSGPLGFIVRGLRKFVNPKHSVPSGEGFERLVFFPVSLAKILRREGADLVFVSTWAKEMVFHPDRQRNEPYGEDFKRRASWVTFPAGARLFCKLLASHQLPLLGSHDLVYHLAGFSASLWPQLDEVSRNLDRCLDAYFSRIQKPCMETVILPFMAVYLADNYAQPALQDDARQIRVLIDTVLGYIDTHGATLAEARADERREFPSRYPDFMNLMFSGEDSGSIRARAWGLLDSIVGQLGVDPGFAGNAIRR
jgi:hypothetical protein